MCSVFKFRLICLGMTNFIMPWAIYLMFCLIIRNVLLSLALLLVGSLEYIWHFH